MTHAKSKLFHSIDKNSRFTTIGYQVNKIASSNLYENVNENDYLVTVVSKRLLNTLRLCKLTV